MSRTTAGSVAINQQSGEVHATGGVVSSYLPHASGSNDTVNWGAGAAHVSADSLEGSSSAGHVTYSGHARMWQGQSLLEAEQIQIWRDEKKMEAQGHVVAVFPQAPGTGPSFAMSAAKSPASPSKPTLWQIHAPSLTYLSDQGKVHLDGGVTASSEQGSLESRSLDVFLSPATAPGAPSSSRISSGPAAGALAGSGNQQLSRVLAQGGVIVRLADRRGTAQQAEYTAVDQKFVLSGGQPTITDASSDTTTAGRSLTFFVANDTILIDSQEGLRTLTKHRVEK
jgi:lipopolysaccharide export system protein LptA